MKFPSGNTLLVAGALSTAANAHIVARDASAISQLLQDVFQSMTNADNHVLQFIQEGGDVAALKQSGEDLVTVLADGVEKAQALQPLSDADVAAITPISQQLSEIGTKFLQDLGNAAPQFAAGGFCSHALQYVGHLSDVSNAFFETNKQKFPADGQEYAEQEIKSTNSHFADATAALSPPNCVDADQGGHGDVGKGQGEPSKQEPGAPTSVAWHAGEGPSNPTSVPQCGAGGLGNGHGGAHGNGTHADHPKPQPVKGSGNAVTPSVAVAALLTVAGLSLTL